MRKNRELEDIFYELTNKSRKFKPYRTQYNILVGKYHYYARGQISRIRCSNCNSLKENSLRYLLCIDCLKIKSLRIKNKQY